jgi:hypothetical protein
VRGRGVVLGREPMIEAEIARSRLRVGVEQRVAMPLPGHERRVSRFPEQLRQRYLGPAQMDQVTALPRRPVAVLHDPVVHAARFGFRPVSKPTRDGEQTGAAE